MPRVTVVLPLYNKAPYIVRALESVRRQTFADFEAVVIDDGSTDGGERRVAAFDDPRCRLIRQANAGPGAARNRGLAEARGDLVAFLDGDDEWRPTFLEQAVRRLDSATQLAAVASGYLLYPGGRSTEALWRRRRLEERDYALAPDTAPLFAVHLLAYLHPCTTVARTVAVRRWGGFYDRDRCLYAEDAFLWLKVLLNERVGVSFEPLTHLHTEASALSANLGRARPVEPFLTHPEEVRAACPAALRGLLDGVLALRALKTASVLGYWGQWLEGQALLRRFCRGEAGPWRYRLFAGAAASPLGAAVGSAHRLLCAAR
jgi:glycosyltransferase involved in cell wall biosynthesis